MNIDDIFNELTGIWNPATKVCKQNVNYINNSLGIIRLIVNVVIIVYNKKLIYVYLTKAVLWVRQGAF